MQLEFYFNQTVWADKTDIYIILTDQNGHKLLAKPMNLTFEPIVDGLETLPSLSFSNVTSRQFFPALVEALAKSGYRYESSDAGELKATKVHLQDMRRLVFEEK